MTDEKKKQTGKPKRVQSRMVRPYATILRVLRRIESLIFRKKDFYGGSITR